MKAHINNPHQQSIGEIMNKALFTISMLAMLLMTACAQQSETPSTEPNGCTPEQKATQACTKEYIPVCGWSDPAKIQCIKYPCASTFGNKCEACAAENVISWSEGECPQ